MGWRDYPGCGEGKICGMNSFMMQDVGVVVVMRLDVGSRCWYRRCGDAEEEQAKMWRIETDVGW